MAPVIISGLLKYINQNEETQGYDGESIKGYAYVACGLVAKKGKANIAKAYKSD